MHVYIYSEVKEWKKNLISNHRILGFTGEPITVIQWRQYAGTTLQLQRRFGNSEHD